MEQNPDITNPNITKFPIQQTIQKPKLYPDITNKHHHETEVDCTTDQQRGIQNLNLLFYLIIHIWIVIAHLNC